MLVISAANISQKPMFSCDLRIRKKYDVFRKNNIPGSSWAGGKSEDINK